jgi:hypothetical protein
MTGAAIFSTFVQGVVARAHVNAPARAAQSLSIAFDFLFGRFCRFAFGFVRSLPFSISTNAFIAAATATVASPSVLERLVNKFFEGNFALQDAVNEWIFKVGKKQTPARFAVVSCIDNIEAKWFDKLFQMACRHIDSHFGRLTFA